MDPEHQALIDAQREATKQRVAVVEELLAETRATLASQGVDPLSVRALENLATERALLDALDANTDRMLRVFEDAATEN